MKTKRDFINEIKVNEANFKHCAETGVINGTLLLDIENAMQKYADHQLNLYGVGGSALLSKSRQMRLEQRCKIDSYTEYYSEYDIGTLNGIDRIVKLIERYYR